jgi:hypothetical protein
MKTELEGQELDAAVASALGMETSIRNASGPVFKTYQTPEWLEVSALEDGRYGDSFQPSTAWQHGGPIIEGENIQLSNHAQGGQTALPEWSARCLGKPFQHGPTPLIAAMRAFVASKA